MDAIGAMDVRYNSVAIPRTALCRHASRRGDLRVRHPPCAGN
jgi:hypothetical protein